MENVIINGETISELKKIKSNSIDMIFADPPYWMRVTGKLERVDGTEFDGCDDEWDQFSSTEDYETFTRGWLSECKRILKKDGSIWVIGGMQCIYMIGYIMQELGLWFINDVIWQKTNPTPNFKGTRLNNSHETLIWAAKNQKSKFKFNYKTAKELNRWAVSDKEFLSGVRKQLGSIWKFPVCTGSERMKDDNGEKLHSTQKPLALLKQVIAISSSIGDTILDPFGGTMTTAAAAKEMGRKYITIEREEKYCKFGEKRLQGVRESIGQVEMATYDIKPIRVSMEEMIKNGAYHIGEKFYVNNGNYGILTSLGKIDYHGTIMDMHSCAAIAQGLKSNRVNGFDYWYVVRDGKKISISDIREKYRKEKHG